MRPSATSSPSAIASGIDRQASRMVMPAASTSSQPRLRITAQPRRSRGANAQLAVVVPPSEANSCCESFHRPILLVQLLQSPAASSLSSAAIERIAQGRRRRAATKIT